MYEVILKQLVTILYRFAGFPSVSGSLSAFPDAGKAGSYAVDSLTWAADQGLLTGKDDGTLDPTDTATRAEVATLLMRYCTGE